MSDYTPEVGHRVRVVLEGEVQGEVRDHGRIGGFWLAGNYVDPDGAAVVSVERLPDPLPTTPGSVVVLASGHMYVRAADGWHRLLKSGVVLTAIKDGTFGSLATVLFDAGSVQP